MGFFVFYGIPYNTEIVDVPQPTERKVFYVQGKRKRGKENV